MSEKTGPKPKYKPELGDVLLQVASEGGHQAQMFIAIGQALGQKRPISPDTFAKWRKTYPEFEAAYQDALTYSKAFYENLVLRGGCGLIPGYKETSIFFTLHNKFPDEYKRGGNGSGGETPHTTVNIVNMTPDEIKYKIAQKQEYLRQKGQLPQMITIDSGNDDDE